METTSHNRGITAIKDGGTRTTECVADDRRICERLIPEVPKPDDVIYKEEKKRPLSLLWVERSNCVTPPSPSSARKCHSHETCNAPPAPYPICDLANARFSLHR